MGFLKYALLKQLTQKAGKEYEMQRLGIYGTQLTLIYNPVAGENINDSVLNAMKVAYNEDIVVKVIYNDLEIEIKPQVCKGILKSLIAGGQPIKS